MDDEIRRLALSALLLGFRGTEPPRWLEEALGAGLGGVVLFASNVAELPALTDRLRAAAGRDVVIALDEEGGDVTRLDAGVGSSSPGAAALGRLDDPDVTEAVHHAIGSRLAAAGVTTNLAPVADVNNDPANPVIGVRSFGADGGAARHVAAAVRGLQRAGVAACAKHFPGHGATSADSHHEVATVLRDADELAELELPAFVAAIGAGARAVMTGHLLVPAFDPDRLATVSPAITTGVLRERLGFAGTIVTDALEMKAVSATIGMVDGFVGALVAGADAIETGALEYPSLVEEIPRAVQRAVDTGTLTVERLRDAAARTAQLAVRGDPAPVPMPDVAPRCLEVRGPLPVLHAPLVLEARPPGSMASGALPWELGALIPGAEVVAVDGERAIDTGGRDLVVVVRDPDRHRWQHALVRLAAAAPNAVIVDVGWPARLPDVPTIRTRGVAPPLLRAAADLLSRTRVDA